jgi:hypothetical protein
MQRRLQRFGMHVILFPARDDRRSGLYRGVALVLLVLSLALTKTATAADAYPGGYTLMPLEPGPVRLLALMVDVSLNDDGRQAWVDVQSVYKVHNTDKARPATLRVAFPGYAVAGSPAVRAELTATGRQVVIQPGRDQWWVGEVNLAADERLSLVLTYRAPLGAEPFVRFRYPLDLTAQMWPGRLESARLTLALTEPPNPQSWLWLTPPTYQLSAEAITWSYDGQDPDTAVDYVPMRPTVWAELRAARQATAAPAAPAAAYKALGDLYTRLAMATVPTELASLLPARYLPLAVAAYRQAIAQAPTEPGAYTALSDLYRYRAGQSEPPDPTYLALATDVLALALENGVRDPLIAATVERDLTAFSEQARQRREFALAAAYLERLDRLAAGGALPAQSAVLAATRARLVGDWAMTVLSKEGPAAARALVEEQLPTVAVTPPSAGFARLGAIHLEVTTRPGRRQMRLVLVPRREGEALIQTLFDRLRTVQGLTVQLAGTQPPTLVFDLPFADASELERRQRALAASLPAEPEWAILAALWQPSLLQWLDEDTFWRGRTLFRETVDLRPPHALWEQQALALENAALQPATGPLDTLLNELWRREAEEWRRLRANTDAQYTLVLYPDPGAALVRSWTLRPGDTLTMSGEAIRYPLRRLAWSLGGAYAVFVLLTAILWWRRRLVPAQEQGRMHPAADR